MAYDFEDRETLKRVDECYAKGLSNLTEEETELVIEYKADVKAKKIALEQLNEHIASADAKEAEYDKKLSELSDATAQAAYDAAAKRWESAING